MNHVGVEVNKEDLPWTGAPSSARVGIVAGWGNFPVEVAARLREAGKEVFIAAIAGHADPALANYATEMRWFGVAKLGAQIRFFQHRQVPAVVMAGKIFKHRILHHGWGWVGHFPDWTCIKALHHTFVWRSQDGRDDTLLTAIVRAFEREGIAVLDIHQTAANLLVPCGCLTKRRPNRKEWQDIQFGWSIARDMGRLDIGQSITVKDQIVLGVEAIEGTDALIARTGQLCPRGGFCLIKNAKPQQDMRFDVPTIGARTVQQMARAGGRVIAVEAGKTIFVERAQTIRAADRLGIALVAVREENGMLLADRQQRLRPPAAPQPRTPPAVNSGSSNGMYGHQPRAADRAA
ncbi:MAG: hypothetical protein KatS3mg111_2520 [Pirellulaceae bacterium]|nr:MAG: hypothetical protein KatS3mg111_2520 [Pirellulaceae bacterium]